MRRVRILVGTLVLVLAILAVPIGFEFLQQDHGGTLEDARSRVRMGTEEAAVVRAVGRPPDGALRGTGADGDKTLLRWRSGDADLYVVLDGDGAAANAWVAGPTPETTLWERFRGGLGW